MTIEQSVMQLIGSQAIDIIRLKAQVAELQTKLSALPPTKETVTT